MAKSTAKNQSKFGRIGELKVTMSMRARGASAKMSPGSRGAADVIAKFPSGTKWAIQVKRTRSGNAASPGAKDMGRLKNIASHSGATAVIAKVSPAGVEYTSARTGRKLTPPGKR